MTYHEWVLYKLTRAMCTGDEEGAYYWTRIYVALVR